jgi:hypothetical protein
MYIKAGLIPHRDVVAELVFVSSSTVYLQHK